MVTPPGALPIGDDAVVVVVGAGVAGVQCTTTLRSSGFAGQIVLLSAETQPPYYRPYLSKNLGLDVQDWSPPRLATPDDAGVTLRLGCAVTEVLPDERKVVLESGEALSYTALVLATGSAPRYPLRQRDNVLILHSWREAERLREAFRHHERVTVVGSGFLAAELAEQSVMNGLKTKLVSRGPVLSSQLGGSDFCDRLMVENDVEVVRAPQGWALAEQPDSGRILLPDGNAITDELVLLAVGATPSLPAIRLADGSPWGRMATCDSYLRVDGLADVLAVGDVATYRAHTTNRFERNRQWGGAREQGMFAARVLMGQADAPYDALPCGFSEIFGVRMHWLGDPTRGELRRPERLGREDAVAAAYAHGGEVVGALAFGSAQGLQTWREVLRPPSLVLAH